MPTPAPQPGDPPSVEDARDLEIVRAIRAGDTSAWTALIRRYQDRLFGVCLRMLHNRDLAADCTQDAFLKVTQGLDKYDGRSKFSTWAIRVTMNVCLSKLRSEKLRRHASLDAPFDGRGLGGDDPQEGSLGSSLAQGREPPGALGVEREAERRLLIAALRRLDDEQRAILILRDGHTLDYEQIAETLGVPVGTVKSRIFRARVALREKIEELERAPRAHA